MIISLIALLLCSSNVLYSQDTTAAVKPDTVPAVSTDSVPRPLEGVVITATRSNKRIEDEPLRVEVIDQDEINEKIMMAPGDISMVLNETGGLRIQTTSPSLGGANVRVQGLRGRYTQILSDGLPIYGGQTGSLGLLQIPPMDLRQVEVIKGVASALYGGSALGGVINLVSRYPKFDGTAERELLINQTSLQGTDAVAYASGNLASKWRYTLLGSAHKQNQNDPNNDGWADVPEFTRVVLRPRFFLGSDKGHSLFATLGATSESRRGGTLRGRTAPDGSEFIESLGTHRYDGGIVGNWIQGLSTFSARASITEQLHEHRFGVNTEGDRHETWFTEGTWSRQFDTHMGPHTFVAGAAVQQDAYIANDIAGFDYRYTTPSLFAQDEATLSDHLSVAASVRVDRHSEYGTFTSPRLSMLLKLPAEGDWAGETPWTLRASAGSGFYAPTPFTEETEVIGLSQLTPLAGLRAERAMSTSVDLGGSVGPVDLNTTVFQSRITYPTALYDNGSTLTLVNAGSPTRTGGVDMLARLHSGVLHVVGTYGYTRSTELDVNSNLRRQVPLMPRQTASLVGMIEREERSRVGIELYYTGRQSLEDNPYRAVSRPYVLVGLLLERWIPVRGGTARAYINFENITNVRQTRYDPLLLPAQGKGGRWTTDAWAPLDGRYVNAGVRLTF